MEAQTAQPSSNPSSATYPRWVTFQQHLEIEAEVSCCSTSGDASKTLAAARTSTGLPIQASLRLAEPPAVSCVCLQIPDGLDARHSESEVLAAHGDSVLIMLTIKEQCRYKTDHFVYHAGAAAADPPRRPSLSLLPPFHLGNHDTGLVRRGEDELVVAQLQTVSSPRSEPATTELMRVADLSLFRAGEWSVRRLQISFRDASEFQELPAFWNAVVPVGDRLLCWVDLRCLGFVICDVFEETPRLQYLPLPRENIWGQPSNRNVCATAGGSKLKFVNIFPRCCCGGAGASSCERSRHAYTVHTWTMRIGNDDDDMEWVKDGMVDATELWALDYYKGLRRFPLDHPVVSMDDPDLVCFWLHEPPVDGYCDDYNDWSVDVLMVNMRSKTIHSVSRYEYEYGYLLLMRDHLIPSNVSCFFNSYPASRGCYGTLIGPRKKGIEGPPPDIVDEELIRVKRQHLSIISTNPMLQPASFTEPSVQASEIFEAFQEIPSYGLEHDEVKVYRILSHDNGRRVRSLLRLPKNVRKDWLLMEIKANEE